MEEAAPPQIKETGDRRGGSIRSLRGVVLWVVPRRLLNAAVAIVKSICRMACPAWRTADSFRNYSRRLGFEASGSLQQSIDFSLA